MKTPNSTKSRAAQCIPESYVALLMRMCIGIAPHIVQQPTSLIVTQAQSATFVVIAAGDSPLAYQWRLNGMAVAGATTASLTFTNIQPADGGSYDVLVSNVVGSVTSMVATLTVNGTPPSITAQPVSRAASPGGSASFTVAASGNPPPGYQWRFNGTNIAGAWGSSYTLASVQTSNAGSYSVRVTNIMGAVTSSVATLTLLPISGEIIYVTARKQPSGLGPNLDGTYHEFTSTGGSILLADTSARSSAADCPPRDGSRFIGAVDMVLTNTTDGFAVSPALSVPGGVYRVDHTFSAAANNINSNVVMSLSCTNGFLSVSNTDRFQARYGTNAWLTLCYLTNRSDSAVPWLDIRYSSGEVTNRKRLDIDCFRFILAAPIGISSGPQSQTASLGSSATFAVTAVGMQPLSYQWLFNGTPIADDARISGSRSNRLSIAGLMVGDVGSYRVTITNNYGSVTSSVAALQLGNPPLIVQQPQSLVCTQGASAGLSVTASGTAPLAYQWCCYATNVPGATDSTFTQANVQAARAGPYTVIVTNSCGSVTSELATLTVRIPATILQQPASLIVTQGQNAMFTVAAVGEDPLGYQWRFNGTAISGATGTSHTVLSAPSVAAGNYDVIVSGAYGSETSQVAVLTVLSPPNILAQPQSQAVLGGSNVTFTVVAGGTAPFSYQWRLNGAALAGATNSSLALANVQLGQAGAYSVTVTNLAGLITSDPATLAVISDVSRIVRLIGTNAWAGGAVTVPVSIVAQGNENALAFSVAFDPSLLVFAGVALGSGSTGASYNFNTNQAGGGKVGVTLAMPIGLTFAMGTQEVVRFSFQIPTGVDNISAVLGFANQPVTKEVSDTQALPLPATFVDGNIPVGGGYEGDVTPLPNGNGVVTITDWVKVGRYVAGLDTVPSASQFQKADCAPRTTQGDGALTVSDWVQAGRYAAGLDPLAAAGGPTGPQSFAKGVAERAFASVATTKGASDSQAKDATGRVIRVPAAVVQPGQTNSVPVQLISLGDENALGFSLTFDPALCSFVAASLGSGASGATLNVNTNQLALGRLGIGLGLPMGVAFAAGTQEVVQVVLSVVTNATGTTTVNFADQPIFREISDALANSLSASYQAGVLSLGSTPGKPLKLLAPDRQTSGLYRLTVGNADGSLIESQRSGGISLWATTNLLPESTNWSKLPNVPFWTNGMLWWDDGDSTNQPSRFYRTTEP
jgi:hypothetical protein